MPHVQTRSQSDSEELANALSHGSGALLAAVFSPQCITRALEAGVIHAVAAAIFCGSMILLFSVSAAYHWLPRGSTKDLLRRQGEEVEGGAERLLVRLVLVVVREGEDEVEEVHEPALQVVLGADDGDTAVEYEPLPAEAKAG